MKYIYILLLVIKEIYLYVAFLLTTGGRDFAECSYTRQRARCTRQSPAKIFSAKGLCRVLFIGALGKIKNNFAECLGVALGKIFSAVARRPLTVILPSARTSTRQKKFIFFLKNYFAECPCPGTRQSFFYFFLNNFFAECPSLGTRQRIFGFF